MTSQSAKIRVIKPSATRDFEFFYEGLNEHRLLVQKCKSCSKRRHPASPMCPHCNSLDWQAEALGPTGSVYSYIVHHQPPYPDYPSPHAVALVEMAPDIRILGPLVGCAPGDISIGMQVRVEFEEAGDGFSLHRFHPTGTA